MHCITAVYDFKSNSNKIYNIIRRLIYRNTLRSKVSIVNLYYYSNLFIKKRCIFVTIILKKKTYIMSKLVEVIISAIQDKKAKNIVSLDLTELDSSICDAFVICNAESTTQVSAIVDEIEDRVYKELNDKVIRIQGKENSYWIAMDFGDVIVHVFQTEARNFYRLEDMWSDAKINEYESFD